MNHNDDAQVLEVRDCSDCPFEYDGLCQHKDSPADADVDLWRAKPPWCPLRKQPVLVKYVEE